MYTQGFSNIFSRDTNPNGRTQRELGRALLAQSMQPQQGNLGPLNALASIAQGAAGGWLMQQGDQAEQEATASKQQALAKALQQYGSDPAGAASGIAAADPEYGGAAINMLMNDRALQERRAQFDQEMALRRQQAEAENLYRQQQLALGNRRLDAENAPSEPKPYRMTAQDQKAFNNYLNTADSTEKTLSILDEAINERNRGIYSGYGAELQAKAARLPVVGGMIADKNTAANTLNYNNLLDQLTASNLKATFGGQFTRAEGEWLQKLQAIASKTPEEQEKILKDGKEILSRVRQRSLQRAEAYRTGDIYKLPLDAAGEPMFDPEQQTPDIQSTQPQQLPVGSPTQPPVSAPGGWSVKRIK